MSQHDYMIANAAGSVVRGDLNDVLAAIASQNSGATEPTTTYAYMLWADTANDLLKQRNAANDDWITIYKLSDPTDTICYNADNLSNLASVATARTNLGLGTAALLDAAAGTGDLLREILDTWPDWDHLGEGEKVSLSAGEDLVFGNACYIKSDGKAWKTDADASSTMPVMYLALDSIATDASGLFLRSGIARDNSWAWTVGGAVYASCTPGALTQTAPSGSGDQVQRVGVALDTNRMDFNPSPDVLEVA